MLHLLLKGILVIFSFMYLIVVCLCWCYPVMLNLIIRLIRSVTSCVRKC